MRLAHPAPFHATHTNHATFQPANLYPMRKIMRFLVPNAQSRSKQVFGRIGFQHAESIAIAKVKYAKKPHFTMLNLLLYKCVFIVSLIYHRSHPVHQRTYYVSITFPPLSVSSPNQPNPKKLSMLFRQVSVHLTRSTTLPAPLVFTLTPIAQYFTLHSLTSCPLCILHHAHPDLSHPLHFKSDLLLTELITHDASPP
jgi:hypothetical protein